VTSDQPSHKATAWQAGDEREREDVKAALMSQGNRNCIVDLTDDSPASRKARDFGVAARNDQVEAPVYLL
jgi:hypothetical protein